MADVNINALGSAGTITEADLLELFQPSELAGTRNRQGAIALLRQVFQKQVRTALSNVAGTVTLDCSAGRNFTLTLAANVSTFTLTNLIAGVVGTDFVNEFELEIKQDATGGRTFALPASFKALGGSDTAIAAGANAVTVLSAKSFDYGTTWRYAMQESA